jgi:putative nucleotidyltransferase with HDIG domain
MSAESVSTLQRSAVIDFAHALVNAVLNRLLHARDSRFVGDAMQEVVTTLTAAKNLGVAQPLQLQIDGRRIWHDGQALEGPSLQARSLLERCSDRNIAMLSFREGLSQAETNRLFDLLLLPENVEALDRNHREATLIAFGIQHVRVTLQNPADPDNRRVALDNQGRALDHYQNLAAALQQNHRLAQSDHELASDVTATAVERAVNDFDEPSMLLSLSMQDDVDRFTVGHSVRVALLALQVARAVGASREQLVHIGSAALMHDIGKSKVPQEILFKQGRLTEDEWQWMAQHPRLGAQILIEQHEAVDPRTIGAAFCHHMGADGGGYPEALMPTAPSATSRLIRVCDVFEALTAVRPYKRALTPIEAFAIMFRNAEDFDQHWLKRFAKTLGLFPTGTHVQMRDGAKALVVKQTADVRHPIVTLLTGPGGEALSSGQPDTIETGLPSEGTTPLIAGISTHDRYLPVPDFDPEDPAEVGPMAHDACLSQHPHDHSH